ncbi:MAG: hypothetical protein GYA16_12250 [Spirochaetes bacterium]|nr:hypothetical protein [Spirochaetota bacterium]
MATCDHPLSIEAKSNEIIFDAVLNLGATVQIVNENKEFNFMIEREKFPFSFNPDNVSKCKGFSK